MKEKDFDHIVKQKLEAVNEAPPAYMWDRVASGIAAQGGSISSGLSATKKILLVAASIVFVIGLVAIFSNQNHSHKRHANKPFIKSWHKKQLIKSHKNTSEYTTETTVLESINENPNTTLTHTPKQQQTISSPSKATTNAPINNTVGVKSSKKQNAMLTTKRMNFRLCLLQRKFARQNQ